MTDVWIGLFSGIAFGFVIQRVGATNPQKMVLAHLMKERHIPQFMLLVVIFSAMGLFALQATGVGTTRVLPTSLVATGLGGILFGIGWGLAGYCPGTCWAAVGEGRMDAIFALLGGLVGTAFFAHLHEFLVPALYMPTNLGQITLTDGFGHPAVALGFLVLLFGGGILLIGRLWGRQA
ncbi:DUF6691 family protein [Desulfuromonas acetoxidans]|uniref:Membrane protein, putative n=1 Tax=Desulfuromonas acetoxidans (strain DSM 684 / 11070) TaxID=281689 RepID=Q1K3E2_DESA6|nr:DUF6691 family protein [Desulfuromonas acetoxidans]EAT17032.1 membrane protein, putative [Desulfuromonas acetoxidans DSM 684]MBF0645158.1 YeeE/YedE family protein [Desulfuromonas acetoxidans]NVD24038.1 YeeE/YedE family protein [Desulfuromonas acetoxidans]NVE16334.1 YeeE/YedE family protein [Desulfuromonas acetoxidans]